MVAYWHCGNQASQLPLSAVFSLPSPWAIVGPPKVTTIRGYHHTVTVEKINNTLRPWKHLIIYYAEWTETRDLNQQIFLVSLLFSSIFAAHASREAARAILTSFTTQKRYCNRYMYIMYSYCRLHFIVSQNGAKLFFFFCLVCGSLEDVTSVKFKKQECINLRWYSATRALMNVTN